MVLREFIIDGAKWELLEHDKLVGFWQEIATATFGDMSVPLGVSMHGILCIFTEIPHPDDPRRTCTYVFNPMTSLEGLLTKLAEE